MNTDLHTPSPNKSPRGVPAALPSEIKHAAKWPPDDSDVPNGPGGGGGAAGGGYGGGDEGNFKKGAIKPVHILLGLGLVVGGTGLAIMAMRGEQAKMTKEQIADEKKAIQLLPMAEQIPRWRKWAAQDVERHLQQEAFAHLAWAKDGDTIPVLVKGLASQDHGVRGTAAIALTEFGSPAADSAKPALVKSLAEADPSDKPQICWALAVLREASAFDTCLPDYKAGHLSKVQRLDLSPAFDPEDFAKMVSLDKLATLAGDPSESVRQLVATALSQTGDAKWTDVLVKLVEDKSIDVAREAAVGLGKIANEQTMAPLLNALGKADKPSRQKFLEALRDGVGGKGLVLALKSVSKEKFETEKFQTKQIFDMIRDLEDPRGADALYTYIQSNPHPHWKTEASMRLAEIGDPRAAEGLGWRLKKRTDKTFYNEADFPELLRDDNERVFGARLLADLAILHPDKREQLRKAAEDAALSWIDKNDPVGYPWPHANALRFLVAAGSTAVLPKLRAWSDPSVPLPSVGQQPPMPEEWATAQSALRYLGWSKDASSWSILERQLNRRPAKVDASWESLFQGGLTILGMTLRAVGYGAAQGLAQWGDPKAYGVLVKHIEEKMENEQSRNESCFALSWVASDDQMKEVVKKVRDSSKSDKHSQFLRACYLETLIHRPVPAATAGLLDLMTPSSDMEVRHQVARAIGMGGVTKEMVPQLFEKLKEINTKADAALALILGGDADVAMRTMATYNDDKPEAMEELKEIYNRTFGYWSDHNYEVGDVARWVDNAQAIAHVKVHDSFQDWPKVVLSRNIVESIEIDNGPHSMTRTQFRYRLWQDAKGSNEAKRAGAIAILKFMKEKGVLMTLRHEAGPVGEMARKAFFEVMNPKLSSEHVPDAPKAKSNDTMPSPGVNVVPR